MITPGTTFYDALYKGIEGELHTYTTVTNQYEPRGLEADVWVHRRS
jgi:hypothetical protein